MVVPAGTVTAVTTFRFFHLPDRAVQSEAA